MDTSSNEFIKVECRCFYKKTKALKNWWCTGELIKRSYSTSIKNSNEAKVLVIRKALQLSFDYCYNSSKD